MKFGSIPSEDLAMKDYPLDTAAGAVVLGDFGKLEFMFKEDDINYRFHRHKRIKILKRADFDQGDILIPYYSKGGQEDVKGLKVFVFSPDGKKVEVAKSEVFDEEVNRSWSQKRFSCPNVQEGSVIEYEYDIQSEAIFQLPEWYFQEDIPVRWSELRYEIPEWYDYVYLTQGRVPDISESNMVVNTFHVSANFEAGGTTMRVNCNKFRYVMKDVPALQEESFITTMDDYYARIRFQLSVIKYPRSGEQLILSSWSKVAEELMNDEDFGMQFTKPKNYDKAWAAAQPALAGAATPEEKLAKLYEFILANVSHEKGTSYSVRKSLNDCFEKKRAFGSEMNLLMVALLREAGITAHPVLLSTRTHGKMTVIYPILDQFDHVMALAEIGDKRILLDLANPNRPPGYPALNSLNTHGWVVKRGTSEWMEINPPSGSDTWLMNFTLDATGRLKGSISMSCDGYSAVDRREQLDEKPAGDDLKASLSKLFPDARIDSIRFENKDNLAKPLKALVVCELANAASVANDFIYLTPAMLTEYAENPFKSEKRTYPVDIPHPFKEQIILNLTLPEGYVVEDLPEPVKLVMQGEGGRFHFQLTQKGNQVQVVSNLQVSRLRFEVEEYETLRGFFSMVAEKLGGQIVLKKS
ncbi:MAG: DUF3857 and transglutaminase domain-containing protein [Bacteroidetes bacterium]|nr:DUF3857 and transglutaminase domain-containing protein [Bacteroidota bacterium]